MTVQRTLISDFNAANPLYAGSVVTAYGITAAGVKDASNIVTAYEGITGANLVANPQTLDSEGKWITPPYVDEPVILTISGPHVAGHDSGVIRPSLDSSDVDQAQMHASRTAGEAAMAQQSARKAKVFADAVDPQQIALIAQSFG